MNAISNTARIFREARGVFSTQNSCVSMNELFWCWVCQKFAKDKPNLSFQLGQFSVSARNLSEFSFLFREIFLQQEYLVPVDGVAPLIIDCGANVGFATLYFKMRHPGARIICFEPDPSCIRVLRNNVEKNGLKNVQIVEAACGKSNGKIPFFLDNSCSLMNSVNNKRSRSSTTIEVSLIKLSDYITEQVDLLKLDMEGSELDVVQDLFESHKLSKVARMVIEYHHRIGGAKDQLSRFLAMLEDTGFSYDIRVGIHQDELFAGRSQDVLLYASRFQ